MKLLLILLMFSTLDAVAQKCYTSTFIEIRDAEDGSPIVAATVTVKHPSGISQAMAADTMGNAFVGNVNPEHEYEVAVSAVGYDPTLMGKRFKQREVPVIYLNRSASHIPGVVVVAYSGKRISCGGCRLICRERTQYVDVEHPASSNTRLLVYPNPVKTQSPVTVQSASAISGSYHVVNSAGQLIQSGTVNAKVNQFTLDFQRVAAGLYFITLIDESGKTSTGKVVVE